MDTSTETRKVHSIKIDSIWSTHGDFNTSYVHEKFSPTLSSKSGHWGGQRELETTSLVSEFLKISSRRSLEGIRLRKGLSLNKIDPGIRTKDNNQCRGPQHIRKTRGSQMNRTEYSWLDRSLPMAMHGMGAPGRLFATLDRKGSEDEARTSPRWRLSQQHQIWARETTSTTSRVKAMGIRTWEESPCPSPARKKVCPTPQQGSSCCSPRSSRSWAQRIRRTSPALDGRTSIDTSWPPREARICRESIELKQKSIHQLSAFSREVRTSISLLTLMSSTFKSPMARDRDGNPLQSTLLPCPLPCLSIHISSSCYHHCLLLHSSLPFPTSFCFNRTSRPAWSALTQTLSVQHHPVACFPPSPPPHPFPSRYGARMLR